MNTCPHIDLEHGSVCQIATRLAGVPVIPRADTCDYCSLRAVPPRAINRATVSAAIQALPPAHEQIATIVSAHGSYLRSFKLADQSARLAAVLAGSGVGSQLWSLLESLAVRHSATCDCLAWAERMNAWGPPGCRLARAEIVAHMRASAKNYGWGDLAIAAAKAMTTGLAWRINPLDIYGSLLDEAIRRAEKSGPPGSGGSHSSPPEPGQPLLPIDILLPLGPGSSHNNAELRFALRSIEAHAQGLRRIVIVGAIPAWLRETDRVLPVRLAEFKTNKASRISSKIEWAFQHLDLTPTVAFWNDDYVLTRSIDIRTIKDTYHGSLRHPHAQTSWQRLLQHAASTLSAAGLPTRHYDIHVPILLRRDLYLALADWWDRSRREAPGLVMKSVYGNHHCQGTSVVSPDKKLGTTWRKRIDSVSRLWLFSYGDDALKTGLANWLQHRFPTPSPAESTQHAVRGPAPQTIVCVLGPFRSGTSAVAGLLHRLGVPMGTGWISRHANPGGTYEDQALGDLCRRWFPERRLIARAGTAKRRNGLRRWAKTRPALAGAKHPSLCLCVPQIVRAWPGVRFVVVDRPPAESIASLVKIGWRQHRAASAVTRLIAARDRDLARYHRPVIRIDYHQLLADPAAAVDQLTVFLGLTPSEDQRRDAIAWIDPSARTVHAA
jgi:hypothetical protein